MSHDTNVITVVSLHSTPTEVTLFTDKGERIPLPTNELRTGLIVAEVVEALAKGQRVAINLGEHKMKIYTTYQEKVGGLVKFFRVAKKALTGIDTPNLTYERVREIALPETFLDDPGPTTEETTVVAVIEPEVKPVPEPTLIEQMIELGAAQREPEAVFVGEKAPEPVPETAILVGAEKLANQIQHGGKNDPEAVLAFMRRVMGMKAQHTAQELLDFLNQGDLPLTKDGCIVAYKRLRKLSDGMFVDSHSGKVRQRVGSRVFMDPKLVDPDRKNQCSNGLHVGQRSYMGEFSGSAILIIIVAPEDVIAVPKDYGGSKMRCCGYDIVAEVNEKGFDLLCSNKPMTGDPDMARLLTQVIQREHVTVDATVQITGPSGTGLVFSENFEPKTEQPAPVAPISAEVTQTKALTVNAELGEREKADPAEVAPAKIADEIKKRAPNTVTTPVEMTKDQKLAQELWAKLKDNSITKAEIARRCNTSTRSLDRWEIKFGFK